MLDLALNHVEELQEKFRSIWFVDKYKFWNCTNYYEDFKVSESSWDYHQFVSLDHDGEIIGYIGYSIDRPSDLVDGLNIINFTDNKIVFGVDVGNAIRDIFEKFNFRKLNFCVVIGNPIEESYDKLIIKYGGRIVGTQKEQAKLFDGKFYDEKLYEITRSDYLKRGVDK